MVVLNECRIDQEGKHLIIEATVDNLSYYKDVYIKAVIVDTDETYSPNGPSDNCVYKEEFESDYYKVDTRMDCTPVTTDEDCKCGNVYTSQKAGVKHIRLMLSTKDVKVSNFNDNIFFVYIVAEGIPAYDCPCGMDNCFTMGVAINMRPVYNMAMGYIKELDSDCSTPKGFIDMILRLKAFELSLKTGNYPIAFKQWKKLFKNKVNVSSKRGCGCGN